MLARLACALETLDCLDTVEGLNVLLTMLRVQKGLKEIGMIGGGINQVANLAIKRVKLEGYHTPKIVRAYGAAYNIVHHPNLWP